MATEMSFVSAGGTFTFAVDDEPLLGRQVAAERPTDQGYIGRQKILCTLNGFFATNSHAECIIRYQQLLVVTKANDALFTYKVDGTTIIQQRVYLDSYNEPADWKEYEGDYSLGFHYFENPVYSTADLGIVASYAPVAGAGYIFDPVPHWAGSVLKNRQDWRVPRVTPGGNERSNHIQIMLNGSLFAADHPALKAKMDALQAAFNVEGTLTYGGWTNQVFGAELQFASAFPRNYIDYSLTLHYDVPDAIIEYRSTRKFDRLHKFPIIKERPFCNGVPRIRQFYTSGQIVNYFVYVRAKTMTQARSLLLTEALALIVGGGIEQPGGTEDEDFNELSCSLSCSKYYYPPIHQNLAGTGP